MVGGNVLSRLEKGNLNNRIHGVMKESEKEDNDLFVMGWEKLYLLPRCPDGCGGVSHRAKKRHYTLS